MPIKSITHAKAESLIRESSGKIFTVTFRKKSTGTMRTMNARLGVKKHLKGTGKPRNVDGLITLYELGEVKAYRSLYASSITELKLGGKRYRVTGNCRPDYKELAAWARSSESLARSSGAHAYAARCGDDALLFESLMD